MFKDLRVRKAISLGINRAAIAKSILRNPPSAATQLLAPGVGQWHDKNLTPLQYDPKKAAQLLDQAGWKLGSDGVRAKDGKPAQFELLTYASRPMLPLVAAAIQDQMSRLGIKVDIKVGESGNISDHHRDGHPASRAGCAELWHDSRAYRQPLRRLWDQWRHMGGHGLVVKKIG